MVLINILHVPEENVYSLIWEIYGSIYTYYIKLTELFKSPTCLLINGRGLFKFPTMTVDLSISPCNSVNFCFMYFENTSFRVHYFRVISNW